MNNIRKMILEKAIAKFDKGAQRDTAIEELSELIRALARCDNAGDRARGIYNRR